MGRLTMVAVVLALFVGGCVSMLTKEESGRLEEAKADVVTAIAEFEAVIAGLKASVATIEDADSSAMIIEEAKRAAAMLEAKLPAIEQKVKDARDAEAEVRAALIKRGATRGGAILSEVLDVSGAPGWIAAAIAMVCGWIARKRGKQLGVAVRAGEATEGFAAAVDAELKDEGLVRAFMRPAHKAGVEGRL